MIRKSELLERLDLQEDQIVKQGNLILDLQKRVLELEKAKVEPKVKKAYKMSCKKAVAEQPKRRPGRPRKVNK